MSKKLARTRTSLPTLDTTSLAAADTICKSMNVSRDVLAAQEAIEHVWTSLPRLVDKIPEPKRSVLHVRMCAAISIGLFDSAINYAWNSAIAELRSRITSFGLRVVSQLTGDAIDEKVLSEMKDISILELCLELNLIGTDDHFFLDQCREIRNEYSVAHPPPSSLDEDEVINFISRIARHALSASGEATGVDSQGLLTALKAGEFTDDQRAEWSTRLENTHSQQRRLIFGTLHGLYCDPSAGEDTRQNCLALADDMAEDLADEAKADVVDRHAEYTAKGDGARSTASRQFFKELSLQSLLGEPEQHLMVTSAAKELLDAHRSFNNFHTEPVFAKKLRDTVKDLDVPKTAKPTFVRAVATAATGNQFGVSFTAEPVYLELVKSFTPDEIRILLELPTSDRTLRNRIETNKQCKRRFKSIVASINTKSIPAQSQAAYNAILRDS